MSSFDLKRAFSKLELCTKDFRHIEVKVTFFCACYMNARHMFLRIIERAINKN